MATLCSKILEPVEHKDKMHQWTPNLKYCSYWINSFRNFCRHYLCIFKTVSLHHDNFFHCAAIVNMKVGKLMVPMWVIIWPRNMQWRKSWMVKPQWNAWRTTCSLRSLAPDNPGLNQPLKHSQMNQLLTLFCHTFSFLCAVELCQT